MFIRKNSLATKYIVTVCVMLLVLNAILGVLLIRQSGSALRSVIRRHMISVAETASAMIDGDALRGLTADDVGTEPYSRLVRTLRTIKNVQNDTDIKYIYIVRRENGSYVYIVDPDPIDPAEFGEAVVETPAQDAAWFGNAETDPEPIEDAWGCYYTSWCSVKDSDGTVVGMVGVDFAADWYDQQMSRHTLTVVIVSGLTLLISILIMILLTWQLSRRFQLLDSELSTLTENVERFAQVVIREHAEPAQPPGERIQARSDTDVIRLLSEKIRSTQQRLTDYMQYLREQAFTDTMTGVGNKDAYLNRIKQLNHEIDTGDAAFAIAVFDVNGLKKTNDNYGHECGDRIIADTSMLICRVFGRDCIYRVGGDEFIAVLQMTGEAGLHSRFDRLCGEIEHFNREEKRYAMVLSISCGGAVYLPGQDASYKEVFKRADMAMYRNKEAYYRQLGIRPHPLEAVSGGA